MKPHTEICNIDKSRTSSIHEKEYGGFYYGKN